MIEEIAKILGDDEKSPSLDNCLVSCVTVPVIEELIFRGLLQSGIGKIQEIVKRILPPSLPGIQLITSPITAIVLTQFSFGLAHLPQSPITAFIATIGHESVLQYVTGGRLYAPIGAHIAHNCLIGLLNRLRRTVLGLLFNILC